nr:Flp family type IVb pilin [Rhodopseudomonas sp. WA056]
MISRFRTDTRGATSIEYALIAVGISIVIVGLSATLGTNLAAKYSAVKDALP